MAFTHFWHLLHIHRNKIIFFLFAFLLAGGQAAAQSEKMIVKKNLPGYENRLMHYGFYLAGSLSRFQVEHSQEFADQLQVNRAIAINPKFKPVFNTGFVLNLRVIPEYLDLRFLPGVGFYTREVEYEGVPTPDSTALQRINSTMIELPLMLKYKSKRRKNSRMYFVGGIKSSLDVSNRKKDRIENQLRSDETDFSLEYGVGLDLFYPFFKFAPELRFSHGMKNMLVNDNNAYARSLQRMNSNTVTLYLFFE